MLVEADRLAQATGDWRQKPEECYREAAATTPSGPPTFAVQIVHNVGALA